MVPPQPLTPSAAYVAAADPTLWNSLPHDITDCVTDVILPETENFFLSYIISMTTLLVVLEVFI